MSWSKQTSLLALVLVLSCACGCFNRTRTDDLRIKEAQLKELLYNMRNSIDQYTQDKSKAPQTLNDLVSAGYMQAIPKDPFTNSSETWQVLQENSKIAIDQTTPGITDVHSGSNEISSEGTPYSKW